MKPIHSILPLLLALSILGCKPPIKIVCGITDQYEGNYNIEFTYAGCNSLTLSNVELASGEIKEFKVQLGLQGKERKLFDVDLAQKR